MNLAEKIHESNQWLHRMATDYLAPAILLSFGKDSVVMLHLARKLGYRWPCISFQDPWWPERYNYAQALSAAWGLEVHTPPAQALMLYEQDGMLQTVTNYGLGTESISLPRDVIRYDERKPLGNEICLRDDFFRRPLGTMAFPWDAVAHGQKATDTNPIFGKVGVTVHKKELPEGAPDAIYPLKNWTDDDVWDYIEANGIPVHEARYDVARRTVWQHRCDDIDYMPACARCVDRSEAANVWCPKAQAIIRNASADYPYLPTITAEHHQCERPPQAAQPNE